ncbi:hypothetical protein GA0116948_101100 [Chitinophaga costaii]|uniref:Uncharacterized protein n=1 Tax=Chitinophaga costaii TaxID=1335309 RepID=A0A1C3YTP5_9BACT|nr:hypothetical protein [Chitinophaga costaii]PUZ30100.1 hypothetical protein DCM91_01085 [Chitinophaga costaii]SCB73392.1 hypothetical protein GA0116948_101100 [Chitinophaga costaii]
MQQDFRPSAALKPLASELAALMSKGDINNERMKELIAVFSETPPVPARTPLKPASEPAATGNHIGIWQEKPAADGIHYYRDIALQVDWSQWAYVHHIKPKSEKRRILLLGESVARGYLYDPYYNVAIELEAILNESAELHNNVEVIDLARISQTLGGLTALVNSCGKLEPDLVIIFAGNNWMQQLQELLLSMPLASRTEILHTLKSKGLGGIRELVENGSLSKSDKLFESIRESFIAHQVPVLLIVPEFNLQDWRSNDIENSLAQVSGEAGIAWLKARGDAAQARTRQDHEAWLAAVSEMLRLDPLNALGHEWLGDYYVATSNWNAAREAFETARDLVIYRGSNFTPRCNGFMREKMLYAAAKNGMQVVDLPALFKSTLTAGIPNRSLFLDYCHLSVEGIKTAMRFTAQKVLSLLAGVNKPLEAIPASAVTPASQVQAIAHFGAAIHNAHFGQSKELVQYHCKKSIGHSGSVVEVIKNFIDFSARETATIFCSAFEDVIVEGGMRQYEGGLKLAHERQRKLLDIPLAGILATELTAAQPNALEQLADLWVSEHGVGAAPVELTSFTYSTNNYNEFTMSPRRNYYQSRTLASTFHFIAKNEHEPHRCTLTFRTPHACGREVEIYLNDDTTPVYATVANSAWKHVVFNLPGNAVGRAANVIKVRWPVPFPELDAAAAGSLEAALSLIYPVFGEVFSFTVQTIQ